MRIKTENLTFASTDLQADRTSEKIWLGHIANFAIQLAFTGSPNGTFKLQASVDHYDPKNPQNSTVSNWTDIANSSVTITAAGDHMWTVENAGYTFVRVVWTDSSSGVSAISSSRYMVKGV